MTEETALRWTSGNPSHMGVAAAKAGVNFAFAAPRGAQVTLVLQDPVSLKKRAEIPMVEDATSGCVRSVCVGGIRMGRFAYHYVVDGVKVPDPYAEAFRGGSCISVNDRYDWEDDKAPLIPVEDLIVYKLHVKGFTKKAPKFVRHKGTFRGLMEAADYIKKLGMNAVLLQPAYEWDPALKVQPFTPLGYPENKEKAPKENAAEERVSAAAASDAQESVESVQPESEAATEVSNAQEQVLPESKVPAAGAPLAGATGSPLPHSIPKARALKNFWGYAETNYYFAPKESYASGKDSVKEFKGMVKALHAAGIEVMMEFYVPHDTDPSYVMRAIRNWKMKYHVDGFHFLGDGVPMLSLVKDPLLMSTKMMFERIDGPWATGGEIPDRRNLIEYNTDFEKNARRLLKSDERQMGEFAARIRRNPVSFAVLNFMAETNGFTLADSVSFNWKHNEDNGEDNGDGSFENDSWNCGAEGPTRKKVVRELRLRQVKNALVYTFLAQGVPMLLAGDEALNTQGGNNNTYASDNPVGWVDWKSTKDALSLTEFVQKLAAFRAAHPIFHMKKELKGTDYRGFGLPDISFHDTNAWVCSFENDSRTLAVLYNGRYTLEEKKPEDNVFCVCYNAHWEDHSFALPDLPKGFLWAEVLNTSNAAGKEFSEEPEVCENQKYSNAGPRSVVVLMGIEDPHKDDAKPAKRRRARKKNGSAEDMA